MRTCRSFRQPVHVKDPVATAFFLQNAFFTEFSEQAEHVPVEHAVGVPTEALADSRDVLARFGNMSSATILFVLAEMMARDAKGEGLAIAFGPGLAAEAIRFSAA